MTHDGDSSTCVEPKYLSACGYTLPYLLFSCT